MRHTSQPITLLFLVLSTSLSLTGCEVLEALEPTPTPTVTPTATSTPSPTATATVTPSPTPNLMAPYTIEGLRAREYPGGEIEITTTQAHNDGFSKYLIRYPSDELTITGMMNVPTGEGPFPVVILNHGYIPPSRFWSGADTWRAADHLAVNGFLTISPDFRGWGGSDSGPSYFRTGLVIDILNLVSSLPSLPQADPERLGMWGHSMGGGATTKAIAVDSDRIRAAVLYAPVSADDAAVMRRWHRWSYRVDAGDELARAYLLSARDPAFLALTSPIHYFDDVTAAVQIHQGTADTSTPPEWAEAIRDAMNEAGTDMDYFSYQGQGHSLQGEAWTQFLQRITAFYERTLAERP